MFNIGDKSSGDTSFDGDDAGLVPLRLLADIVQV